MAKRNRVILVSAAVIALAACSSGAAPAGSAQPLGIATAPAATEAGCVVGVSWDDQTAGRWAMWDEPAIKKSIADAGAAYISTDAKASAVTQATNIESLLAQGTKVLIIVAHDGTAIQPSVSSAISHGVAVIAYDRLIEDAKALYLSFDNVEVGRMQARALLHAAPNGNYVFIKGDKGDANSDFLRAGQDEIIKEAVDSGAIKNVGETYTDNWDQGLAQTEMESLLKVSDNGIDAVLSENDGMASGVIAALAAQGLAGQVAISGQDGDGVSLNDVALGTQTVDVWKDARMLGKAAGDAAGELCAGVTVDKVAGATPFTTPGGNTVSSILLKPTPVTKANLDVVVDAGWISRDELCKDVKAGSAVACP